LPTESGKTSTSVSLVIQADSEKTSARVNTVRVNKIGKQSRVCMVAPCQDKYNHLNCVTGQNICSRKRGHQPNARGSLAGDEPDIHVLHLLRFRECHDQEPHRVPLFRRALLQTTRYQERTIRRLHRKATELGFQLVAPEPSSTPLPRVT
jgi:hypothetical protein